VTTSVDVFYALGKIAGAIVVEAAASVDA